MTPGVKMPVRIGSNMQDSCPTAIFDSDIFDSDMFAELDIDNTYTNYEDLWANFQPTPPQSPHTKNSLDFIGDSSFDLYRMDDYVVNNDCMWSTEFADGLSTSPEKAIFGTPIPQKPVTESTSFSLSTSPVNTFNEIGSYEMGAESILKPINESFEPLSSTVSSNRNNSNYIVAQPVVNAMNNDHSYESSCSILKKDRDEPQVYKQTCKYSLVTVQTFD